MIRITLFIFLLCLSHVSFGQKPSLVGHWRRIDKSIENTNKRPVRIYGDYIFNADSTFVIVGDSAASKDTVPGWHVGEELTGTWSLEKTSLWLRYDGGEFMMPCRVINLSVKGLVLKIGGSPGPGIRFMRL